MSKKTKEKAFNNWKRNAIHLTFPNGNAISTTWAYLTYSDNNDMSYNSMDKFNEFMQSDTVEIMILNAPDKLVKKIQNKYDFEDDSVKGYLNITEWLEILNLLAKGKEEHE